MTKTAKTKELDKDTQKKLLQLNDFIAGSKVLKDKQSLLMGVLHQTQTLFGYIPATAMDFISHKLGVPSAHIYGMATFYNYFQLTPKARYQIYLCKGTACYVAGGARVLDKLKEELRIGVDEVTADGLFGINITRCLGCCGLSPVMQVNDDIYVRLVPEKVPAILAKYRRLGQPKKKAKATAVAVGGFEQPGK